MSNIIPFVTQEEEPTMATLPLSAKTKSPAVPTTANKKAVQLNLFGVPSFPSTKSITIPSLRKKNGTLVAAHTRHVKVHKPKSNKKSSSKKQSKPNTTKPESLMFVAPDDCKESVALAFSLHMEEHKKLMDSFFKKH